MRGVCSIKKILVLEDESGIRSFVVINLRRNGYEPIEAATGGEALDAIAANPDISVALLDVMVPDIDGFEVCRKTVSYTHLDVYKRQSSRRTSRRCPARTSRPS